MKEEERYNIDITEAVFNILHTYEGDTVKGYITLKKLSNGQKHSVILEDLENEGYGRDD